MATIREIKNDILSLRGTEVRVFEQPIVLASEFDETTIDIIDVLDALADYEITELWDYRYDEDTEEDEEINIFEDCEDIDDMIRVLEEYGYIRDECDYKGDNSYNWSSPISNDFNINIYKNILDGGIFVEFKVHRYGDVRGNYTDSVLLKFDYYESFFEILMECNKSIEIEIDNNLFEVEIDILSDSYEVYNKDWDYICNAYGDIDDIKECILEKVNDCDC